MCFKVISVLFLSLCFNATATELSLTCSSDKFDFYCTPADQENAEALLKTLEDNYARIAADFKHELSQRVSVYVYPDIDSFHVAIGCPEAGGWYIGNYQGLPHTISVVSPSNPGPLHTGKSVYHSVLHNLTQAFIEETASPITPLWFSKGTALVEAQQGFLYTRSIQSMARNWDLIPDIFALETYAEDISEFRKLIGYPASYLYVKLILEEWGWESLLAILRDYEALEDVLGVSKEELRFKVISSLIDN